MMNGAIMAGFAALIALPAAIVAAPYVSSEFAEVIGTSSGEGAESPSAAAPEATEAKASAPTKQNANSQTSAPAEKPAEFGENVNLKQKSVDWKRSSLSSSDAERGFRGGILPAGVKSILNTSKTLTHGQYMWEEDGVADGDIVVFVDLRRQMVSVFQGGHEIGTAVVVYGAESHKTPLGRFPIRWQSRDYHSRKYDAPMPYSLFLTEDRVALHGSPMSATRATHGCIGIPLNFARRLFEKAGRGDIVQIVRSDPQRVAQAFAEPAAGQSQSQNP